MENSPETVSVQPSSKKNKYLFPLILITSLFFFWGFIHNLDPVLIPHLKSAFQLSDLESSLIDFSIYIAYFIMAIPAGRIMKKYGYKNGILIGLSFFALGAFLFIPAAKTTMYVFFLGALFIIACGLAFLETAANPYITILGPKETATWRLNFAQSFNGLAAFLAPIVGGKYILTEKSLPAEEMQQLSPVALQEYMAHEANSVVGPYLVLGIFIVLLIVLFKFTKLPEIKEDANDGETSTIRDAWRHKHLRWAVIAQFFYVGAQVCVLSFFIRFIMDSAQLSGKEAAVYAGFAGLAFMIGRFVGTFFMKYVQPHILLMIYALISMVLTAVAIFASGSITIYALIGVAFFMSIMFPTIFSLGITDLGKDRKIGSSLIVMAVVGGAVLPLFLGYISDVTGNIQYGYIVPLLCFVVIFIFGKTGWKPVS